MLPKFYLKTISVLKHGPIRISRKLLFWLAWATIRNPYIRCSCFFVESAPNHYGRSLWLPSRPFHVTIWSQKASTRCQSVLITFPLSVNNAFVVNSAHQTTLLATLKGGITVVVAKFNIFSKMFYCSVYCFQHFFKKWAIPGLFFALFSSFQYSWQ